MLDVLKIIPNNIVGDRKTNDNSQIWNHHKFIPLDLKIHFPTDD